MGERPAGQHMYPSVRSRGNYSTYSTAPIHTDTHNLYRPDLASARRRSWSAVGGRDSPRSRPSVERVANGAANQAKGQVEGIKKSRTPSGLNLMISHRGYRRDSSGIQI